MKDHVQSLLLISIKELGSQSQLIRHYILECLGHLGMALKLSVAIPSLCQGSRYVRCHG